MDLDIDTSVNELLHPHHIAGHRLVKDAVRIALIGGHSITFVAANNYQDAVLFYNMLSGLRSRKGSPGAVHLTTFCPCGNRHSGSDPCECRPYELTRWQAQPQVIEAMSADIVVAVREVPFGEVMDWINSSPAELRSADMYYDEEILPYRGNHAPNQISEEAKQYLLDVDTLSHYNRLSFLSVHSLLEVAKTVARMDASPLITSTHIEDALRVWRPRLI